MIIDRLPVTESGSKSFFQDLNMKLDGKALTAKNIHGYEHSGVLVYWTSIGTIMASCMHS